MTTQERGPHAASSRSRLPLVSIGLIGQKVNRRWFALEESGISDIRTGQGSGSGSKGTRHPTCRSAQQARLTEADVELINVGFDPRVLTEGRDQRLPGLQVEQPDTLSDFGFDLVMWDAADYGIPTLGLAYVATETMVQDDPKPSRCVHQSGDPRDRARSENQEEALDVVMEYVDVDSDRDHQRYILESELADATSRSPRRAVSATRTLESGRVLPTS